MSVIKMGRVSGDEFDSGLPDDSSSRLSWIAVTNSNYDTSAIVYQYGIDNQILPIAYVSQHPVHTSHRCTKVSVRQQDGEPRHWRITADYSSKPTEAERHENPLNRPAKIKWKTNRYQRAIWRDVNGKALVNSAGDYYDPPFQVDRSHWTATITKNVANVPSYILEYEDAVNDSVMFVGGIQVDQYAAKIDDIDIGEKQKEGEYEFHQFTYTLEFRRELWIPTRILDQGTRYRNEAGDLVQITDNSSAKRPVSSPRLLNGNGGVLSDPTPETAVFGEHTVYYAYSFLVLPGITAQA